MIEHTTTGVARDGAYTERKSRVWVSSLTRPPETFADRWPHPPRPVRCVARWRPAPGLCPLVLPAIRRELESYTLDSKRVLVLRRDQTRHGNPSSRWADPPAPRDRSCFDRRRARRRSLSTTSTRPLSVS